MKKKVLFLIFTNIILAFFPGCKKDDPSLRNSSVSDIDGNTYKVILIGRQLWMSENLKTTKYNDGTAIPNITAGGAWNAATTGAYCDYDNNPANSAIYGRLYNWYVVDNNADTKVASNGGKNVCPAGWHVPADIEWTTLINYLTNNGYGFEGSGNDIAKSMAATSGWASYETPGTVGNDQAGNNKSGFTALPGGWRSFDGAWWSIGRTCSFWSSSKFPYFRPFIDKTDSKVILYSSYMPSGYSVRCLRDF